MQQGVEHVGRLFGHPVAHALEHLEAVRARRRTRAVASAASRPSAWSSVDHTYIVGTVTGPIGAPEVVRAVPVQRAGQRAAVAEHPRRTRRRRRLVQAGVAEAARAAPRRRRRGRGPRRPPARKRAACTPTSRSARRSPIDFAERCRVRRGHRRSACAAGRRGAHRDDPRHRAAPVVADEVEAVDAERVGEPDRVRRELSIPYVVDVRRPRAGRVAALIGRDARGSPRRPSTGSCLRHSYDVSGNPCSSSTSSPSAGPSARAENVYSPTDQLECAPSRQLRFSASRVRARRTRCPTRAASAHSSSSGRRARATPSRRRRRRRRSCAASRGRGTASAASRAAASVDASLAAPRTLARPTRRRRRGSRRGARTARAPRPPTSRPSRAGRGSRRRSRRPARGSRGSTAAPHRTSPARPASSITVLAAVELHDHGVHDALPEVLVGRADEDPLDARVRRARPRAADAIASSASSSTIGHTATPSAPSASSSSGNCASSSGGTPALVL